MLIDLYAKHYLDRFHEPATVLWPRDMGVSAKLLKIHPFAKLSQWVREFVWSDDKQIADGGRSFPQFQYHLSRIITASTNSRSLNLLKGVFYDGQRTPIRDAVALLATNFQKMDLERPQTRSYERTLDELKDQPEILMKAVELLIDEHANGRQFYPIPKPSDVKGACAKVIEMMRLKAFALAIEQCDHQPKGMEEITREDGSTVLQRCSHWKIGHARMDEVAKKLSLPASSERLERIGGDAA